MHPIYQCGCRAFQAVFRAALPILPYRQPKLLDTLEEIIPILQARCICTILLVADGTVRDLGLTQSFEHVLADAGIACHVYEQRTANPTIDNVEDARHIYIQTKAQAIVAIGGGSAIDCAKVVGARIARPRKSVQQMRGLLRVLRSTPLFIAAPTTAGTGSETTLAAVITNSKTHHKYPINDFALIPYYAVLDARLTLGLPPQITATTGLDALTHAIEAYIGRSTNKLTRSMAEEAVKLICKNLHTAYQNGQNLEARQQMLRAAYCAGIAFTRSYVGYVHGVAHSLGGQYGIAHGLANAVILPIFLREYGSACTLKLARLARKTGVAAANTDDSTACETFIRWIEQMNADFGLPNAFPQIRTEDIPHMARHAAHECNPLYPVPRLMDRRELETIYHKLMPLEESI